MASLLASRDGIQPAVQAGGGGLLFVHSHGQTLPHFEAHARMLSLLYDSRAAASAWLGQSGQLWSYPPGHGALRREQQRRGAAPRLLHEASLLIANNNAPVALRPAKRANAANSSAASHYEPTRWLQLYTVPLRLRMLVLTSANFGYMCGELQALAASWSVVRHFPWVLYSSGPDSLPTPLGMLRYGALMAEEAFGGVDGDAPQIGAAVTTTAAAATATSATSGSGRGGRNRAAGWHDHDAWHGPAPEARHQRSEQQHQQSDRRPVPPQRQPRPRRPVPASGSRRPAILCEQFPAYPGLLRVRLDQFVWFPSRMGSEWLMAAADCVGSGSVNPEQTLAYWLRARNVTIRMLGATPFGHVSEWSKHASTAPHPTALVWHAHNSSNVRAWIEAQAHAYGIDAATGRQRAADERRMRMHDGAFARCTHDHGQQRVDRRRV